MSAPAIFKKHLKENRRKRYKACDDVVLVTGIEPVLNCLNEILSLGRLPIPPHQQIFCCKKKFFGKWRSKWRSRLENADSRGCKKPYFTRVFGIFNGGNGIGF